MQLLDLSTLKVLHFNARSIKAKWNEMEAELEQEELDVYCIYKT